MQAREATIAVMDFESTGVVGNLPDEPWQIGVVELAAGRVAPGRCYKRLLRVGERPFSPYAPGRYRDVTHAIHEAPELASLWGELRPWLAGRPLAAHNIATERRFVRRAFPLHRLGPWVDTLKLVRLVHPELPTHKLEDVTVKLELDARVRELCPGREAHDALYDATACAVLLEHLLSLPSWRNVSIEALVQAHPGRYHQARAATREPPSKKSGGNRP